MKFCKIHILCETQFIFWTKRNSTLHAHAWCNWTLRRWEHSSPSDFRHRPDRRDGERRLFMPFIPLNSPIFVPWVNMFSSLLQMPTTQDQANKRVHLAGHDGWNAPHAARMHSSTVPAASTRFAFIICAHLISST